MFRSFIFKFLLFILPIVLFLIYCEIGLNNLPTSYSILQKNFFKKQHQIEVLIIGSSDTQLGISPSCFKNIKGFNLSNSSQTIYNSYKLITNNLKGLENLKLVIFSADPTMLFLNDNNNPEKWREKFYYHFWKVEPEDQQSKMLWDLKLGIYDLKSILTYAMQGFYKIQIPFLDNLDSLGWERGYLTNTKEILNYKTGKEIANIHLKGVDLKISKNLKIIVDLNSILKKQNIKLALILMPKSKYYLKYMPEEMLIKNKKLLDSLAKIENIQVYDFMNDSIFNDNDFRDVNHLNFIGAQKFSIMLSEKIDKYIK